MNDGDTRRLPTLAKHAPPTAAPPGTGTDTGTGTGTGAGGGGAGDGAGGADGGGGGGGLRQSRSSAAYDPGSTPGDGAGGRAGRFWSTRRVPAGIAALLLLAGVGILLYDVAQVRAGGEAQTWRRTLADGLATTRVDSVEVLAGASAVAALGLWLIVLAATPGLRGVLAMRRERPHLRAGLERGAAALVLRDRAMQVTGVQSAKARVGRRRARVRAQAHFRPLDEVRAELDTVLRGAVRHELGLARPLGLSVHVRRPKRR